MQTLLHPESLTGLALLAAIAFALSVAITYAAIRIARRYHLHAIPNERSSHTVPTPQVGGIGVALPVFAFMAYDLGEYAPLFTFALAFFAIGLYDDFAELSPVAKLIWQILAASVPTIVLLVANTNDHTPMAPAAIALFAGFFTLWIVGFVNVFNFMDGMNGYAGSFSVISLFVIALLVLQNQSQSQIEDLAIVIVTLGSTLGFMLVNCKPIAAAFLGDSGSHFLGFLLGFFALQSEGVVGKGQTFLVVLILFMPFLYDASYTLVRRLLARKPFWKAHREHLYQRLMIAGMTHMQVLRICVTIHLLCAGLAIVAGLLDPRWIAPVALVFSLLLMFAYTAYVIRVERNTRAHAGAASPELQP